MIKPVIFPGYLHFVLKLSSRNFPIKSATQTWRSMRKTTLCKKTREAPGCFSSLIGEKKKNFWPIRSGQFKRFWNWFGESKCPGARLDLTVNFYYEHFIDPTNRSRDLRGWCVVYIVLLHQLFNSCMSRRRLLKSPGSAATEAKTSLPLGRSLQQAFHFPSGLASS